jgi:hypothetical protein
VLVVALFNKGADSAQMASKLAAYGIVNIIVSCFILLLAILAIILGIIAISKIKNSGGMLTGKGVAVTAIIAGGLYLVIFLILTIIGMAMGGLGALIARGGG